jgi:hypothetical protein
VNRRFKDYISLTNWLTKQERRVLYFVIGLLATGWAVKYYRASHPTTVSVEKSKENASSQL